jgi:hypothetical protein
MSEVGELVLSVDGQWMVRPPTHCGNGHPITPGHVLVGTAVCQCHDRHLTWSCECGSTVYGPSLGAGCTVMNGQPASGDAVIEHHGSSARLVQR